MRKPVSICMALYNGAKFVEEQIDSILPQLDHPNDEIIIVDDFSKDNSIEVISNYNDPRIKLIKNTSNIGYIKTFEKAINLSKNDIIFLSDQDDIWIENRLILMYNELVGSNSLLLCSNFSSFANNTGNYIERFKTKLSKNDSNKNFKNIIGIFKGKMAYFGCTMAFKKEFKNKILPFPKYIDAHDLWLAMIGNIMGTILHLEENTILHRIHGENTSFKKRKLKQKIYTRFLFFKTVIESLKRKTK